MRYIIPLIIAISLIISPAHAADDFLSSRVKDISDRSYENAVIELLDNAKDSIVVSMYIITLDTEGNHPVKLLLNDLIQARERGVEVTLYLNTHFRDPDKDKSFFMKDPTLKELKDAGCTVHLLPSRYRLHDKLVIVDNRYVAEGSTNWSIAGLRSNFESSTLIDSPGLARIKLKRLENLLMRVKADKEPLLTPAYAEKLPEALTIPEELLLNKRYFPKMVTKQDSRAMKLYILLLAHSQLIRKEEFFVSLEGMSLSLGLPHSWTNYQLRRQVIKSLRKLKFRYNLIDVKFFTHQQLKILPEPTVEILPPSSV